MPCFSRNRAWYSKHLNPTGLRSLVWSARDALQPDAPILIPCGQCIGCRLARSAQWGARCYHEAQTHKENAFITLTFSPEHLPRDGMISKRDCQLFNKRLRKKFSGIPIRIAYCGEYGAKNLRPHYHMLLFGIDFPDKELWKVSQGYRYYRSKILEELWPYGFSTTTDVTYESSCYVARYIIKKQTGISYEKNPRVNPNTGEILVREFFEPSRRGGLGRDWFEKNWKEVYPLDEVIINGRRLSPSKYYDSLMSKRDPEFMEWIKYLRCEKRRELVNPEDETYARLQVRENVLLARLQRLKRSVEDDVEGFFGL